MYLYLTLRKFLTCSENQKTSENWKTPTLSQLQETLHAIQDSTGYAVLSLPLLRDYHIDLGFRMQLDDDSDFTQAPADPTAAALEPVLRSRRDGAEDIIQVVQDGLPLVERPYREIGELLEIPEKTVKSRLFTARQRLRAGQGSGDLAELDQAVELADPKSLKLTKELEGHPFGPLIQREDAPAGAAEKPSAEITLTLKDADIKDVLKTFSVLTDLNFVLDPGVSGSVTVELREVPWDQALDLILKINGLDYVLENNVLRVAPISKLAAEKSAKAAFVLEQERVVAARTRNVAVGNALAGCEQGIDDFLRLVRREQPIAGKAEHQPLAGGRRVRARRPGRDRP